MFMAKTMLHLLLLTLCCVAMVTAKEDTTREKRLVLHSDMDVANAIEAMSSQIHALNTTVDALQNAVQSKDNAIQSLQSSIQAKDNTVQTLNATVHNLQSSIQAKDNTVQSLNATVQNLQTAAQTRDSTIQFLHSTVQSMQTAAQTQDGTIQALRTTSDTMASTLQSMETKLNTGISSTYIRWGRTTCPGNGTELVYEGFAAGSWYSRDGGAADFICLSQEPLWGYYTDGSTYAAKIYGAEYQMAGTQSESMFGQDLHQHDAPCAVCRVPRAVTVMIPGRNQCYAGWSMEYSGYLVSGYEGYTGVSNYACLDKAAEVEQGDSASDDGHLMYVVEGVCGTLKCPPYVQYREITCVVCSL